MQKASFLKSGTQILVTKKKNGNRTETSQQLGKPFIGIEDIKVCLEQFCCNFLEVCISKMIVQR
jgi:hypothetical protein